MRACSFSQSSLITIVVGRCHRRKSKAVVLEISPSAASVKNDGTGTWSFSTRTVMFHLSTIHVPDFVTQRQGGSGAPPLLVGLSSKAGLKSRLY